jgi:phospholipid/cholesterol/gamma-HCH transport system ATP-binding protein
MSIRFDAVTKIFGKKTVLDRVSFTVETGEILFVLGKSGVGKSVTLKHVIGLLQPDSGSVLVDEQNVSRASREELQKIRKSCGMVFQHPALFDSLSILDNVAFGLEEMPKDERRAICTKTLALVHLEPEILDRFPNEISYGMQKRVSLARTLAPRPRYLLFDEPTTGLDPITTNTVNDLIRELSKTLKITSIVVSHDMNCALKIADRIMVLDQGRILALSPTAEIKKSENPLIRDFLSEAGTL